MQFYKMHLQLFGGEGAGSGAGAGSAGSAGVGAGDGGAPAGDPGVTSDAAGQTMEARLRELGVPKDKLKRRAYKAPTKAAQTAQTVPEESAEQVAAAQEVVEETKETEQPAERMSWDDIMKDPEYNKEMNAVIRARLKTARAAEEKLEQLGPALEIIARKYGLDAENPDIEALAKAVSDDTQYYEEKAMEMGVPVDVAMRIDKTERDTARKLRQEQQTMEEQKFNEHLAKLHQQGEALKGTFPGFDLKTELQNPTFARMTSPNVGLSVEDAYYAVHRKEIQSAAMQVTAQKAAQKISNAIQAGQMRPAEAGTTGTAPSVTTFDYKNATKEQREALKNSIRAAAARGEKIYPGRR